MIYWVETELKGRVGTSGAPAGGDDLPGEIAEFANEGVNVLASMLAFSEVGRLQLESENELCRRHSIDFHHLPITDHGVPEMMGPAKNLVMQLAGSVNSGASVVIHCFAGIGRSSLVAALTLATAGIPIEQCFALISEARGFTVPETKRQEVWFRSFLEKYPPQTA
jgi:protein-tyrosine phosphatase